MESAHPLLARQLEQGGGGGAAPPDRWPEFCAAVAAAYRHFEADRDHLERLLERVSEELIQTQSEMRVVFQALPDLVFRLDQDGTVLDCRGGSEMDFVVPPRDMLGKRIQDLPHQGIGARLAEALQQVRDTRWVVNTEYQLKLWERECFYEARLLPLLDHQVILIIRNITERKQAEQERERLHRELLQAHKMEAVGRLAGGIAHDLNNMLLPIIGYSDLLLMQMPENDPYRKEIEEIKQVGERAAGLTRQLLVFSRKQVLNPRDVDMNNLVSPMEAMLRHIIGENIELVTRLHPGLFLVKGDPGQLGQVVMNLVVNARDAMPDGGRLTLRTSNVSLDKRAVQQAGGSQAGNYVALSVEDTGVGMDKTTLARIFEPFYSTKGPNGTGLGLSVVYGIVQQHGGWIHVQSAPGSGTVFTLYLPAVFGGTDRESASGASAPARRGTGQRILLVEDEQTVLRFVSQALRESGYEIVAATTLEEALQALHREKGRFDLLFSDSILPDGNGMDLLDRIQAQFPHIKALLSSGYTGEHPRLNLMQSSGIPFLQKPYTINQLLESVGRALDPLPGGSASAAAQPAG